MSDLDFEAAARRAAARRAADRMEPTSAPAQAAGDSPQVDYTAAARRAAQGRAYEAAAPSRVAAGLLAAPGAPDELAARKEAAAAIGVPEVLLPKDKTAWEPEVKRRRLEEELRAAPDVAKWMDAAPDAAQIAGDDVGALGLVAGVVRDLGAAFETTIAIASDPLDTGLVRAARRGGLRLRAAPDTSTFLHAAQTLGDIGRTEDDIYAEIMPPEAEAEATPTARFHARITAQERAEHARDWEAQGPDTLRRIGMESLQSALSLRERTAALEFSPSAVDFAERFDALASDDLSGAAALIANDPRGFAIWAGEIVAESIPTMVGAAIATAAAKNPVAGAVVMGGGAGLSEMASSAVEFLAEEGVDLGDADAVRAAFADPDLMARAQSRGVTRGAIIGVAEMLSFGLSSKALSSSRLVDMGLQTVGQAGLGSGGEAAAQIASGQDLSLKEVLLEGLVEVAAFPIEAAAAGGEAFKADARRAARGGETQQMLQRFDEAVGASKLAVRSRGLFRDFLRAQGADQQMLYLPAEEAATYFQSADLSPEDWGIDLERFDEIRMAGGDVAVPLSTYAESVSGTEHATWFQQHASLDPNATASAAGAEALRAGAPAEYFAMAERSGDAAAAERVQAEDEAQVFDQVFTGLRTAGRSEAAARQEATVFTSFLRTMAERYGETTAQMYQRLQPRVAPGATSAAARARDGFDILLNNLRRGETDPAPGPSVMERLKEWGGISDEGGDVGAMDPPKGIVAETREDVAARKGQGLLPGEMPAARKGLGLDEAAERLIEANMLAPGAGPNDVLAAIQEELAGRPRYALDAEPETTLADLAEELGRRGIDVTEMTNDEVVAALEAQDREAGGGTLFQFAGPRARTAPSGFDEALVMQADGAPADEIRAATGWDIGADGRLRFEISDDEAQASGELAEASPASGTYRLDDLVSHDRLFAAYPQLRDVVVVIADDVKQRLGGVGAVVDPPRWQKVVGVLPRIEVDGPTLRDARATLELRLSLMMHEIQHIIQRIEGFEHGTDASGGVDAYRRSAGETEARNTQARLRMTDAERTAAPATVTEDIPRAEQVVVRPALPDEGRVREARRGIEARAREAAEAAARAAKAAEQAHAADQTQVASAARDAWVQAVAEEMAPRFDAQFESLPEWMRTGTKEQNRRAQAEQLHDFDARLLEADGLDPEFAEAWREAVAAAGEPAPKVEMFQAGDDPTPRGSITLPRGGIGSGETIIRLFETADLSTFFHETGHFALETMLTLADADGAPDQMRADMAEIRKWLGMEDGARPTVEQHEKWARGFEAYVMEGKAPSLALGDAFARARAWLIRIYRSVRALNVELSDEVRAVMDRMLATDAEIADARDAEAMRPLFESAEVAGMSPDAFRTYQRMARRATEQAEARLTKSTMEAIRRERATWWKEERERVQAEVEAELDARPEYAMLSKVAGGEGEAGRAARMDRDALVEMFGGAGVLQEIGRAKLGGKRSIYRKGGMNPSAFARSHGFKSVTEMVEILQNTPKRADAVKAETARRMQERHGDPFNDGTIEEEALQAVHSEQQGRLAAAEARALARRAGLPERGLTAEAARLRAKEVLGKMSVQDATRPGVFAQAERRARRKAERAFAALARVSAAGSGDGALGGRPSARKGDMGALSAEELLQEAMIAKQQELVQHMLYTESRALQEWVRTKRKRLADYGKKSVREALAGDYITQIDALLEAFDFRVLSGPERARRADINAFAEKMKAEGREAELAIDERILAESRLTHYSQMTVEDLQGLVDTIANIDHLGRLKQKLIDAQEQRDHEAVVGGVLDALEKNVDDVAISRGTANPDENRRNFAMGFLNTVLSADTLLRKIDGGEDMGPAWSAIKGPVDAAEARLLERQRTLAEDLDKLYGVYTRAEQRAMNKKIAVAGLGDLSKWDLIAYALNTGNAENWERLSREMPGREGHIAAALNRELDARDWKFVQATWDYIESYWPEIAAKEKRQTGVVPRKVRPKPMIEGHGLRGGYYPIKYDPRHSSSVADRGAQDLSQATMTGRFGKAQTKNGHTKARSNSTGLPIRLDIGVLGEHLTDVIYDLEMGEAVLNSWKVLKDAELRDAMTRKGLAPDLQTLDVWVTDIAAGNRVVAKDFERIQRKLRSGFVMSRLGFNIVTVMLQPTGLLQSGVVVGNGVMLRGMASYLRAPARWARAAAAASATMRERQTVFERDVHNVLGDVKTTPGAGRFEQFMRDSALPASMWMMQKVQYYMVDLPTWVGVYEDELKRGKTEAEAARLADHKTELAQGTGRMSSLGALQRGTTGADSRLRELPRLFTALGSYMFRKLNIAYERGRLTDYRSPAQVMKLAVDLVMLFTAEFVLSEIIRGNWPDDDDEEPMPLWLLKGTALSGLATVPIGREFASALQGYDAGGISSGALGSVARPFIQAEQGEMDKALLKSMIDAAGVGLSLPSVQANRALDALLDDDLEPRDDVEFLDLLFGPPKDD